LVAGIVGYTGEWQFDPSKPDGTPRKLLDVHRIAALGFTPRISLEQGIASTYQWFLDHEVPDQLASTPPQPIR
jgi:GDP-L-fucose synthase